MPIIGVDGSEAVLSGAYAPGFPVLVIKENEGIVAEKGKSLAFGKLATKTFQNKRGEKFRFVNDCYDNAKEKNSRIAFSSEFDPRVITAYNTYGNQMAGKEIISTMV